MSGDVGQYNETLRDTLGVAGIGRAAQDELEPNLRPTPRGATAATGQRGATGRQSGAALVACGSPAASSTESSCAANGFAA